MNRPAQAYDAAAGRLIFYGREADPSFWDDHWSGRLAERDIKRFNWEVVRWTKRYLPLGSKVLDGGCGTSHTVWSLNDAGFDAWGVDFAAETIDTVKKLVPDLQVLEGDVRSLPFEDSSFDGIWSGGVIEHFPEGYDAIVDEMARVLRPGGYAFVTFPAMSPLRRLKAKFGGYPAFSGDYDGFYQFALETRMVMKRFERAGFETVTVARRGGLQGLKHEWAAARPALQRIFDSKSRLTVVVRGALNRLLAPFSFHTHLIVFQRVASERTPSAATEQRIQT